MRVCVFTGSRAEFGLLRPLIDLINNDPFFDLKLMVSGSHLSPQLGFTVDEIISTGFKIDEKIEILLASDTRISVSKAMGLGMISFSEALARISPDLVIVLGDRFELLSFASTAFIMGVPIAHIHGGEITEGAYDDGIRHAITKMSQLHFTSTEVYRQRVIQMGEHPDTVYNTGALGLDNIIAMNLLDIENLSQELQFDLGSEYIVVTYHPETNSEVESSHAVTNLLQALNSFQDLKVIFTKANADHGGNEINKIIESYVSWNPDRTRLYSSLGSLKYLSLLKHATLMAGNTSSGIIEMPFFRKPTVNIGDRQKGRVQSESIIQVFNSMESIKEGIKKGLSSEFRLKCQNVPAYYGDGKASERMVDVLKVTEISSIRFKHFYDYPDAKAALC